jgi:dihydrodipicolinate synthase/N-acetylneuraminate lyase
MKGDEAAEKINKKIDALNTILFIESNPIPVKYAYI